MSKVPANRTKSRAFMFVSCNLLCKDEEGNPVKEKIVEVGKFFVFLKNLRYNSVITFRFHLTSSFLEKCLAFLSKSRFQKEEI